MGAVFFIPKINVNASFYSNRKENSSWIVYLATINYRSSLMKKHFFCLLLLSLFVGGVLGQDRMFVVKFIQEGKVISVDRTGEITLRKQPFQIQIEHIIDEGVLVGATLEDDLYRSAIGEADLEVSWYENTGMADALFNDDKAVMVSNDAPNYWFYSSAEEHRFDRDPRESRGRYVGKRTIANIALLDPYRKIPIQQIKKDLYFVFYESTYDMTKDEFNRGEPLGVHIRWK